MIPRDYTRTPSDDFALNVEPRLDQFSEAVPVYASTCTRHCEPDSDAHSEECIKACSVLGWKIQSRYE